jgi:hypothetical protein
MPGEIALTFNQLLVSIDNVLLKEDKFQRDRERLKRITHKYMDAKSTERILAVAKDLMGI